LNVGENKKIMIGTMKAKGLEDPINLEGKIKMTTRSLCANDLDEKNDEGVEKMGC